MSQRLPPQNIEAEESILGGILLDPGALDRIINQLHPDAFYVNAHKKIYQAAWALHAEGQPTDLMSVTSWLGDRGTLEQVGGTIKLVQLLDRTVSAVNIDRYAALMMDKYLRRQLIGASGQINDLAHDTATELDSVLYQSEQSLFEVSNQKLRSRTKPNSEVAFEAYSQLDAENPIYPTRLYDLDDLIVGFEPGTLTLLAGRPSMGKSYCAMFLALQMMLSHERSVLFFSLEMTSKQLEYRLWSLLSVLPQHERLNVIPIEGDRIRKHRAKLQKLETEEIESIAKVMSIAAELPLYLNDDRGITVSGMASECRRLLSEGKNLGLVVVDYLQMMASDNSGNRSYELGDVARELYKMAGDLNVPVLALSQLNRAVEGRNNKRPTMADLSQSGILEMVADNVILVYRDEYYNPDTLDPEVLELIVGKARHGSTGTAKCLFDKSFGLLKNLA
jgi:replicative DNA helicase